MKRLIPALLALLLLFAATAYAEGLPILLKNRTFQGEDTPVAWTALADFTGRHVLVQLAQTPTAGERDDLAAEGLHLMVPVPRHAYLAYVASRDWSQMKAAPALRAVVELQPEDKIHQRVLDGSIESYALAGNGRVDLLVTFFADTSLAQMQADIDSIGAEILETIEVSNSAFVRVESIEDAYLLGGLDSVQWVAQPSPPWGLYNDRVRPFVGADTAHEPPYSVTGAGVNALIYDGGIIPTEGGDAKHPDLAGRLIIGQTGTPDVLIGHASHVACTVGGTGAGSDGQYAGMAPDATIISMDFTPTGMVLFYNNPGDISQSYGHAITDFDAHTANNSIGANIGANNYDCAWLGDYEGSAALIDDIIAGRFGREMIIVWAAGNERTSGCSGDFRLIPPPVPAKNTICVGASVVNDESIAYFSSRGPTDDGRLRPDVTAPGHEEGGGMMSGTKSCVSVFYAPGMLYMDMSGTSQAAPVVTGATALAYELYERETGEALSPSLAKALVIHSAQDLGMAGPDYTFGFGGLRIPAMLDLILDETYTVISLDQGDQWSRHFRSTGEPIKVTLVWTDVPGPILTGRDLVNDLDLQVKSTGGTIYLPWSPNPSDVSEAASPKEDHINPVEQVYIESPSKGGYEVIVKGYDVPSGPQGASLVITGLTTCDADGDGFDAEDCGGDDCNDNNKNVNPNQTEICTDNIDNDCNGKVDATDPECGGSDDDTDDDDTGGNDDDDDDDDNDDDDDGCGC